MDNRGTSTRGTRGRMRLAVLALVLSLAITRSAIAGEVRVDLSQLSELANRGDVVALMQMADAYEEEWNTGGDPLAYSQRMIPFSVSVRNSPAFSPAMGIVLIEVARRFVQKEHVALLPAKQRMAIDLMRTPTGFEKFSPEDAKALRVSSARLLAIIIRQARDAWFGHDGIQIENDRGNPNALPADGGDEAAASVRRANLAGQRISRLTDLALPSFLKDWYGRLPADMSEAGDMALILGVAESKRTEVILAVIRETKSPVPNQTMTTKKLSVEQRAAEVVRTLNAITEAGHNGDETHRLRQALTREILGCPAPIDSVMAQMCCEALLLEAIPPSKGLRQPNEVIRWEERRRQDAHLMIALLSLCRRDRLPLSQIRFKEAGFPLPNELRRFGSSLDDIDPGRLPDPELRETLARLRTQREEAQNLFGAQQALTVTMQTWPGRMENYLIKAYSCPPFRFGELVEVMACAGFSEVDRSRIMTAVAKEAEQSPTRHLLTGWESTQLPGF